MEKVSSGMNVNEKPSKIKQIYSYEEALDGSLKYFDGDELAAKIVIDKYLLRDGENNLLEKTPVDMHQRIAKEFSRIEKRKFKIPITEERIFSLLDRFRYIVPQGSPMFGIGNDYQFVSLSNCFLLEIPEDSYGSILKIDEQLVQISKRRGGVGIDLSNLRPAGTPTKNAAKSSTGIIPFMERYSNSIREVGQNNRRGALMLTLSVHHPEVLEFTKIKNDKTKVTGANISLRLTKEFLNAVKNDSDYEIRFPVDYEERGIKPIISKLIKAKEIWMEIIKNAHSHAEPGLLMWDNITKNTPADCYEEYKSRGTNPCSELNLSPLDSCRLLCLNLFSYVKNPFRSNASFDYKGFYEHAKIAQRLMDDIVDLESEKIDKIIDKVKQDPESQEIKDRELKLWQKIQRFNNEGRRTGTGITALGDTLAALNIKYGSEESIKKTEKIYRTLKLACYESSVEMAEELGPFKCWDYEKEKNNPFLLRIKEDNSELYERMKKSGRRNIALTTTAPTGTISCLTQTSSGIEPVFQLSYIRRRKINPNDKNIRVDFIDQMEDKWQEFEIYHHKLKLWMEITGEIDKKKSPWFGCCAEEIDWINRVKLQSVAQQHVCHAISSTINLPENVSEEIVAKIYETAFELGLKGITIYRKNCRTGVLIDKKEDKGGIQKTKAPKRPKELNGEIHHFILNKQRYYVAVGLWQNNEPYEIFTGINHNDDGEIVIPKTIKEGKIIKEDRGKYNLMADGTNWHLTNGHTDATADTLTRLLSCSLRHGVDISFIIQQIEKTVGPMTSFTKILGRTLKKYIKDGSRKYGESCPSCKIDSMIYSNGCTLCSNCGFSKCQ